MQTFFECKIRYEKLDQLSGEEKMTTETYLFDALTYTEAEERIHTQMREYISGDFQVVSIRKTQYAEIIPSDDGDRWFKAKATFLTIDEEAGKEKKVSQTVLVLACGIKDAFDKVVKAMNGTTDDFSITSIVETAIMDYFPLFTKDADNVVMPDEVAEALENQEVNE